MELMTQRLRLREFREHDWLAVLAYQSDPLYLRYYEWTERTPEAVRAFIGMFLKHQRTQPRTRFQLAAILRATGELIGNCGVRLTAPGSHEADLGYELSPAHWGHGYATEAARAMLNFAFTQLGVHRVWAEAVVDNTGSTHVLAKLGMQLEGRLRDKEFFKDRYWDTVIYAILEQEWRARQEGTLMDDPRAH